jgi:drug/metabolite transporter (DMT)-like permease
MEVAGRDDGDLARAFDVTAEGNLATWFSSTLLLLAAVLLAVMASTAHRARDPDARWWWFLAAGFFYLCVDEAASLHEELIRPVGDLTDASGFFRYAWIVVAIPIVAVVGIVLVRFLRRLPPATARAFVIAGGVFVLGAVVVEGLGGAALDGGLDFRGAQRILVTLEETLENLGVALFIGALLRHMATTDARTTQVDLTA